MSVAVSTYLLLNWLNYSFMEFHGHQISELIPFSQYMDVVLRHQSMEFRIRGAKLGETGDLGSLGYVVAVLQALGFAVGGVSVYVYLQAAPYCADCGKYLKKRSSVVRYTNEAEPLLDLYSGSIVQLQSGNSAAATRLLSDFGTPKRNVISLRLSCTLEFWKCLACPEEVFELSVKRWNGKTWDPVSGLLLREHLPRAPHTDPNREAFQTAESCKPGPMTK